MIEYLEKLVEEEKWPEARRYAEQLLANRDNTPGNLLIIYYALLTGDFYSSRYEAAIPSGHIVISLASELEQWDYYGLACITVGSAYYSLNQEQQALDWWLKYFLRLTHYKRAAKEEALIWYNIGLAYNKIGKVDEASHAFLSGIDAANRVGNSRFAHGIRQGLIEVYLKDNRLSQVPGLLAQCGQYLRDNPGRGNWASYQRLRANHALLTGRFDRARVLALKGLLGVDGELVDEASFHIVLATVAAKMGSAVESLGHALAAQSLANRTQRQYLASKATQIIYDAIQEQPGVVSLMNEYYFSVTGAPGVPKTQ